MDTCPQCQGPAKRFAMLIERPAPEPGRLHHLWWDCPRCGEVKAVAQAFAIPPEERRGGWPQTCPACHEPAPFETRPGTLPAEPEPKPTTEWTCRVCGCVVARIRCAEAADLG